MTEKQRFRAEMMQDVSIGISCTHSVLENAQSFVMKDDPCMARWNIRDAIKNLVNAEKRLLACYYQRKKK